MSRTLPYSLSSHDGPAAPALSARMRALGIAAIIAMTLALFSIPLLHGSPLGDDYVLIEKNARKAIGEIFTSTWSGIFDAYGSPLTSHSDMYRPLVDLTFWLDVRIASPDGGYNYYWTNWAIFTLVAIVVFQLYARLGPGAVVWPFFLTLLFLLHPSHSDVQFALANRTDTLLALFALLALYCSLKDLDAPTVWGRLLLMLSTAAALLTKESGVVIVVMPALAAYLTRLFHGRRIDRRWLIVETGLVVVVVVLYFILRTALLSGTLGEYGAQATVMSRAANAAKVVFYLLFGLEKSMSLALTVGLLAVPLILLSAIAVVRNRAIAKPVLILLVAAAALYGPALLYQGGKRFLYLSLFTALLVVPVIYNALRTRRERIFYSSALFAAGVMYLVFNIDIARSGMAAFEIKARMDRSLAATAIERPTGALVVLPYYIDEHSALFLNGIREYMRHYGIDAVPIAVVSKRDLDEPYGVTASATNDSTFIVRVDGTRASLRVPQLDMSRDEFDNRHFTLHVLERDDRGDARVVEVRSKWRDVDVIYFDDEGLRSLKMNRRIDQRP